jgi:hypothetical protein
MNNLIIEVTAQQHWWRTASLAYCRLDFADRKEHRSGLRARIRLAFDRVDSNEAVF